MIKHHIHFIFRAKKPCQPGITPWILLSPP